MEILNIIPSVKAPNSFLVIFKKYYVGHFFKSLLNLLQYCFCFMFWFFGHKACGILSPQPEVEPTPSALEGKLLHHELSS